VPLLLIFALLIKTSQSLNVNNVQQLGALTGQGAFYDTYDSVGVKGTDLGIPVQLTEASDPLLGFFFGDTFGNVATGWISNCVSYLPASSLNPSAGIPLRTWVNSSGIASELLSALHINNKEETVIPNGGVSFGGTVYLQYMSVNHWGGPGQWWINYSGLATSGNSGQTWTKDMNVTWPSTTHFAQTSIVNYNGVVYFFGTSAGRVGPVYLASVPESHVMDISTYSYLVGINSEGPVWAGSEANVIGLFPATCGETSVQWNPYLNQWVIMYFDAALYTIGIRTSSQLWGPWSDYTVIITGDQYPELYGGYMHPLLYENGGATVYFTVSIFTAYEAFLFSMDISQ